MNDLLRDTLTVWGDAFSAQIRDYTPETNLVLHIGDDAYELSTADAVLLRDVLNAATERGYLPVVGQEQAA
jgi:hypothetical protein